MFFFLKKVGKNDGKLYNTQALDPNIEKFWCVQTNATNKGIKYYVRLVLSVHIRTAPRKGYYDNALLEILLPTHEFMNANVLRSFMLIYLSAACIKFATTNKM